MVKHTKMSLTQFALLLLIAASAAEPYPDRWSRQISSYTSDISDWVPLVKPVERPEQPIKRQAVAQPRILTEPFSGFNRPAAFSQDFLNPGLFQNQARPLYLQSVPTASQNYLNEQGFGAPGIKFALGVPNFPLSKGFVADNQAFERFPDPQKIEQFPKSSVQPPQIILPVPQKPILLQQKRPETPKFIDGYRLENNSNNFNFPKSKPQSLQKLKFEASPSFGAFPKAQAQVRPSNVDREEVQLLYVPVDSLNRQFNNYKTIPNSQNGNRDLFGSPAVPSQSFGKPQVLQQAFPAKSFPPFNSQKFGLQPPPPTFGNSPASPFPSLASTSKPKKLKPHQPPLAVFLAHDSTKPGTVKVADVLSTLKSARNIAVLDSVNPNNSPKVFIGPSSLNPPNNFVKFELPYLSNLENTDKKLRQLPFFVAPLSYNTPEGFAKIPFPSPHVGSVIVNGLLQDANRGSTPAADVIPNAYTAGDKQQPSTATKPTISYFSTSGPTTSLKQNKFQSNFYSFEPQSVTPIPPSKGIETSIITAPPVAVNSYVKPNSFFHNDPQTVPELIENTPPPPKFVQTTRFQNNQNFNSQFSTLSQSSSPSFKPTTKAPSTFPNILLETHNPFSINQAFDFSSPLDVHNNFEDNKKDFVTPSFESQTSRIPQQLSTEKIAPSSPNYLQNYTPEIHYQSEIVSSRFPSFDPNNYRTSEAPIIPTSLNTLSANREQSTETTQQTVPVENVSSDLGNTSKNKFDSSEQSDTKFDQIEFTTTTTKRPTRARGRPRSTTVRPESDDYTKNTRKPIRERRPLPPRVRPSTERTVVTARRQPEIQTTTESERTTRLRTRGRLHFKPTEHPDEAHEITKNSKTKSPEDDIAYQRDVLHQNYPVTLQEKVGTPESDSTTPGLPRISSTRIVQTQDSSLIELPVTEQADRLFPEKSTSKEIQPNSFTPRSVTLQTESTYVPRFTATINEEPSYSSKSSTPQYEDSSSRRSSSPKYNQNTYVARPSSTQINTEAPEIITENIRPSIFSSRYSDTPKDLDHSVSQSHEAEVTTLHNYESSKTDTQLNENNNLHKEQAEEPATTIATPASRPKIRNRPLSTKTQTTTETPTTETQHKPARVELKRRPVNTVTYRPGFHRRTTMRIEEIGSELKTKQIHSHADDIDKHPVYKPDPTTEPSPQIIHNKKGSAYRRRRPTSANPSSTTEQTIMKKPAYETKNRFRGRRPTTEKTIHEESTTVSNSKQISRYTHRTRIPDRYNRKHSTTEQAPALEEQDTDSSIHRPKIIAFQEQENWAPGSFKPFNPNDIKNPAKEIESRHKDINATAEEPEIVTAGNPYREDILLTVTPASNRFNSKIPDIPPTLEAFVEQSRGSATAEGSSIESVIEEMMKSLEEQDEDEYSRNVMKHEHGEIGEIPPEKVIASEEGNEKRGTTAAILNTSSFYSSESPQIKKETEKPKRRGYWKKVRVRPVTTESFELAESQVYSKTVNHLGDEVKPSTVVKTDIFSANDDNADTIDVTTLIPDIAERVRVYDNSNADPVITDSTTKKIQFDIETTPSNPGNIDLGTGSPSPKSETNSSTESSHPASIFSSAGTSFMDYLFGLTSEDKVDVNTERPAKEEVKAVTTTENLRITTIAPTESSIFPAEITEHQEIPKPAEFESKTEVKTEKIYIEREDPDEEFSSEPNKDEAVEVSTSLSTEVSHETEICFRGKCIKTFDEHDFY